jgi:hypothetical protein
MYGDLVDLLVPGFLSTSVDVDGHRIVLRSLSQNDLFYLHKFVRDDNPEWKVHLVAHSVWMVDGIPLLEDGALAHRVVYDHLMRGSRVLLREMLGTAYGFFARMRECNHYLESYLYEPESRRLWRGLGSGQYPLWSKAGIPGVEKIGLNPFQSSWVSWNQMEDERDEQDNLWSNTKVLVSLQSHKGYEQLNNKDKNRDQNENDRRMAVRDRARRRFLYGEDAEKDVAKDDQAIHKARTADELEDEMRRWITGDLDWHDQVVEAYKNRIREDQAAREAEKARIMAELQQRKRTDEATLGRPTPKLKPVSPEDLERIRQRRPLPGAQYIVESEPGIRTFNRYLRPQVAPGNLSVDDQGRIVEKPPTVKEPQSLDEQIANRRVIIDG